jgi:hypothetical protein
MLNDSIAFQISEEFVVGDYGFVAAFCDDCKVSQILEELFIFADGKDHSGSVAVLVGEVLSCLAHGSKITAFAFDVEFWEERTERARAWKTAGCGSDSGG